MLLITSNTNTDRHRDKTSVQWLPFSKCTGTQKKVWLKRQEEDAEGGEKEAEGPPTPSTPLCGTMLKRFPWGPPANGKLPLVLLATAQYSLSPQTPCHPPLQHESHHLSLLNKNLFSSLNSPTDSPSVQGLQTAGSQPPGTAPELRSTSTDAGNATRPPPPPKTIKILYCLNNALVDRHVWRLALIDESHPTTPLFSYKPVVTRWRL